MDLDGVQTEEEVVTKAACGSLCAQVGVGGREHAHVDGAGGGGAYALELAGLEDAKEFRLLADGDVCDLVEEEGSAAGELEAMAPTAIPAISPRNVNNADCTMRSRTSWVRGAPSETRMANSRSRFTACVNIKLATFAHAIKKIIPAAPCISKSGSRKFPANSSRNGTTATL
jgi:hypothetical protein